MDIALLREAYRRTQKSKAPGVDGVTARDYEQDLEGNLADLHERAKSGRYRAPPVRRVHIPKGKGGTRPIGVPTLEDKVLQRAVTQVMEAVYEQDFLDCSHGFRPGRSPHTALESLWKHAMSMGGGWLLEVDIQGFFDNLEPTHLRAILDQRVRDGVFRRLIDKWLKAGVQEDGALHRSRKGTPQGGVISPLLANIYLHAVLDRWFVEEVKPRLAGRAELVRYADDFVILFAVEADARAMSSILAQRLGRFGLTLHPDKTRLVRFQPPEDGAAGSGTFDFLGFTHHWSRSRRGRWTVQRRTTRHVVTRTLTGLRDWCRRNRHDKVRVQYSTLCSKLRGHYLYFGVTGNSAALRRVWYEARRIWHRWLSRRSRAAYMSWARFEQLLRAYPLPPPRLTRSVYAASPCR